MLVRAAGARLVLEIGLAIGYSALHIARALPEYGKVVSLERDMHIAALAKTYLSRDPAGARSRSCSAKPARRFKACARPST